MTRLHRAVVGLAIALAMGCTATPGAPQDTPSAKPKASAGPGRPSPSPKGPQFDVSINGDPIKLSGSPDIFNGGWAVNASMALDSPDFASLSIQFYQKGLAEGFTKDSLDELRVSVGGRSPGVEWRLGNLVGDDSKAALELTSSTGTVAGKIVTKLPLLSNHSGAAVPDCKLEVKFSFPFPASASR